MHYKKLSPFGEELSMLRIALGGICLKEIGEAVGLSESYMSLLSRGKANVPAHMIENLCVSYHLTEDQKKRLKHAADISRVSIKIQCSNYTADDLQLIELFLRALPSLEQNYKVNIQDILERSIKSSN